MFILFGANAFRKSHGQAQRYCLQCDKPTAHELLSEQAWFTLFFVPVVPITWRLFRARCPLCGREAAEKKTMRWTIEPRRSAARFFGWLLAILAGSWVSLLVLVFISSQFYTDPTRQRLELSGLAMGSACFGVPLLSAAALFFLRAAQLRRQMDEGPADDEAAAVWTPATTKKCPRCAEDIKIDALACRHCGQEFDPGQVRAATASSESERRRRLERMVKQTRFDELRAKRSAQLVLGWLCIATCLMFWLGPFLLWKAKQIGKQMHALQHELELSRT